MGEASVGERGNTDSRTKFLTLLHEYTHELLYWTPETKGQSAKAYFRDGTPFNSRCSFNCPNRLNPFPFAIPCS